MDPSLYLISSRTNPVAPYWLLVICFVVAFKSMKSSLPSRLNRANVPSNWARYMMASLNVAFSNLVLMDTSGRLIASLTGIPVIVTISWKTSRDPVGYESLLSYVPSNLTNSSWSFNFVIFELRSSLISVTKKRPRGNIAAWPSIVWTPRLAVDGIISSIPSTIWFNSTDRELMNVPPGTNDEPPEMEASCSIFFRCDLS